MRNRGEGHYPQFLLDHPRVNHHLLIGHLEPSCIQLWHPIFKIEKLLNLVYQIDLYNN